MWDELFQATSPGEPLVVSTCRLVIVGVDAQSLEVVDEFLCAEHLIHSFRAAHHEEVVNLLVELVGTGEDTVVGCFGVKTEDGTAEGSHVGELVHV